jgi:hypothetical protein
MNLYVYISDLLLQNTMPGSLFVYDIQCRLKKCPKELIVADVWNKPLLMNYGSCLYDITKTFEEPGNEFPLVAGELMTDIALLSSQCWANCDIIVHDPFQCPVEDYEVVLAINSVITCLNSLRVFFSKDVFTYDKVVILSQLWIALSTVRTANRLLGARAPN